MNKWLSYIILALGCFGLASCQNDDTPAQPQSDGQVSVHLQISLPGGDSAGRGAEARGVDDGYDSTTEDQRGMTVDDIYVLMFNSSNNVLLKQASITGLSEESSSGTSYYREIEGVFNEVPGGSANVYFVVLANLLQNNLYNGTTPLTTKKDIDEYIEKTFLNQPASALYEALIYNYDGTSSPWNIANRRIPMWGATGEISIQSGQSLKESCDLHRAVAKVAVLVNKGEGFEEFSINKIEVINAVEKGYCVSLNSPGTDNYYTAPSVPSNPGTQTITFDGSSYTFGNEFRNQIYLPEQNNTDDLCMNVHYTYKGKEAVGKIRFVDSDTGVPFDVIRNHSYVFNINKVTETEIEAKLYYMADQWEEETINIGFN